ncbi:DUF6263 family protein [Arenibacter sp. GZD96]|uniref:DUF6263 family protein n=1 Tax=Aurantibrevibacter litoralis TaxID=3106030 RepID=UPI002AFF0271|nr:DUF6263 family protein [Arenibacter sp. GZD-96]MEA1786922.1 DUF6263 family protein [Arenibacter sp. GZD-96]
MKNIVIFLFGLFLPCFFYGQTLLEYRLKIGDVFVLHQNAKQRITQTIGDTEQIITNTLEGVFQLKVIDKQEDQFVLELKFNDLKLHISSNLLGELLAVNAKEVHEGDISSKMYHSLLNSPVKLFLAKNGDILQVSGGDKLVSKMVQAAEIEDALSLDILKNTLENDFGSKALSDSYEQMTFIYPTTPIKVGDTWVNYYDGKLHSKNTWKLEDLTASNATILGEAEVVMTLKENTMSMELNGHQETEIKTNTANGFLKTMKVSGTYSGISKDLNSNEEIPTTITSQITYELLNTTHVSQNF